MDRKVLLAIGIGDALIAVGAPLLDVFHDKFGVAGGSVFLSSGVGAIAVITFIGFVGASKSSATLQDTTREAIAAAFVLVFLVVVAMTTFFSLVPSQQSQQQSLSTLTATVLPSFTQLTSIVMVFYFGSAAVIAVFGQRDSAKTDASKVSEPKLAESEPKPAEVDKTKI